MSAAINHIKAYDNSCKANLIANTEINVVRMLHENPNRANQSFSAELYNLAHKMRPEFLA
jgi:hypothetical protein